MPAEEENALGPDPVRIVQITDAHLFEDPAGKLIGLNCQESFEEVLALIRRRRPPPDCILCTGDIVQDASVAAYRRFYQAVSSFGLPHYWIPGNHDLMEHLREALDGESGCLEKAVVFGSWQILMLDSSVRGAVHGFLDAGELDFLDRQLAAGAERELYSLICVHHNPLPVEASWLQQHALQNSADFLSVLDRHEGVRGVLWGHIHQEFDARRKGVRMLASPSTCIQFHPSNDAFTVDRLNPGYRWLELRHDGGIETGVERVTGKTFDIDFSSSGY